MRFPHRAALALLLLFPAACEETGFDRVEGVVDLPEVVDFGRVQVGLTAQQTLTLENVGQGPVTIKAFTAEGPVSGARFQFTIPEGPVGVGAGQTEQVRFRFQPFESSEAPYEVPVRVDIAGKDPVTVLVRGQGVPSGLEIAPNPLDFETVLAGASRTLDLTLTNTLDTPVTLRSPRHGRGRPEVELSSGMGTFELDTRADSSGLLNDGMPLEPGASLVVPVTYRPEPSALDRPDRARWTVTNCDSPLCEARVDLFGRGTTAALACDPPAVDFGAIPPGRTVTRTLTCTNVASAEIDVTAWALTGDAEYRLEPPAERPTLAPGASFDLEVLYTPTQATFDSGRQPMATVTVDSLHPFGGRLDPVSVELLGRAGGATILVSPERVSFGPVAIGTGHTQRFLVENVGLEDLEISRVDSDVDGTGSFSTDLVVAVLPSGTSTVVTVAFSPTTEGEITSAVRLFSNDPIRPEVDVALVGTGVRLPPCAYRLVPPRLDFGPVRFSEFSDRPVRIENVGTDDCLVHGLEILAPTFGATTSYSLLAPPSAPRTIPPGSAFDVPIRFEPNGPGAHAAELGFYISSPTNSNPRVPLYGVGRPLVEVLCPPAVTTRAGVPVTLTATGMAVGSNIVAYDWALTRYPMGGLGTPNQWQPNPPNAPVEVFLPFIVGVYDVQVTVTDDAGRMAGCTTQVTAEGEGLQVTLTWDGAGDVDLHLHNGQMTSPWFGPNGGNDCYYANRTPLWSAATPMGVGANPELDFDNTTGLGPENTRVQAPEIGRGYVVGVHNFSGAAGRRATLDIFCGGTQPQQSFTSRPLAGASAGQCSDNDFWKVAQVTFTSSVTCSITPIDTYGPSSAACNAF